MKESQLFSGSLGQWFSTGGQFCLQGTLGNVWTQFWLLPQVGWLGVLLASGGWRPAMLLKHPTVPRPSHRELCDPKCQYCQGRETLLQGSGSRWQSLEIVVIGLNAPFISLPYTFSVLYSLLHFSKPVSNTRSGIYFRCSNISSLNKYMTLGEHRLNEWSSGDQWRDSNETMGSREITS